jgi:Rps23 Pro-64 3,4-dihydroxylase Tpa1-like proline 4-hydroxylase
MSLPCTRSDLPRPASVHPDAWLAPRTDLDGLARRVRLRRRVQVAHALRPEVAQRLHARLDSWKEWALVTRLQGQHRAFDAAGMDAIDAGKRAIFDARVADEARRGFQYLYERYPLHDRGLAGALDDPLLHQAYLFLRSARFLEFARRLTGALDITHADGQLTRYRRGHFLTLHDDTDVSRTRIAAFVLNLTPAWPADFGGQLQFADAHGQVEDAVAPRLNSLSVFAVPSPHLVTAVAPFATGARYALTGWFHRAGAA